MPPRGHGQPRQKVRRKRRRPPPEKYAAGPLPVRQPHRPHRFDRAKLRVVQVGNFRPTYSTETHLHLALTALGHDVDRVQEDETSTDLLLDRCRHADLLVYTRTWGLQGDLSPVGLIDRLHDTGVATASYHLDLYRGLRRASTVDPDNDAFWRTGWVFTADGDPDTQTWMEARGVNHRWLPAGVCHREVGPGRPAPDRFPWDVVFVGSNNYGGLHPEWAYRDRLHTFLQRHYRNRFACLPAAYGEAIRGQDLNDLYSTVPVVVGDSLCPGFTWRNYWSDRVYETVGRGGFLVMPKVPGLDQHFQDRKHLRFYDWGDWGQLGTIIDGALDDRYSSREVAADGCAHVAGHHTYLHRMRDLLDVLEAEGAWT